MERRWLAWPAAAIVALGYLWAMLWWPQFAHAAGDWDGADPAMRAWFRSVKSPHGVPCCDIADGHRVEWDTKGDHYRVRIGPDWFDVPPEAVVYNAGNPTGDAVAWYSLYGGKVFIRCFVPGGGI